MEKASISERYEDEYLGLLVSIFHRNFVAEREVFKVQWRPTC